MLNQKLKINSADFVKEFGEFVRQGMPLTAFGVPDSFKSALISSISSPVLFVVKDTLSAGIYKELITQFCDKKVAILPPKDELLMPRQAFSKDFLYERLTTLYSLSSSDVIIAPITAIMQSFSADTRAINIRRDGDFSVAYLTSKLISLG